MQVLYGTGNAAKLDGMREWLRPLNVEIIGLKELGKPIPAVKECGNS